MYSMICLIGGIYVELYRDVSVVQFGWEIQDRDVPLQLFEFVEFVHPFARDIPQLLC
jgi:hypothetical protein